MANPSKRDDTANVKRVELSIHTQMSAMDSVLSLQELIHTATCWGWKAVAVTDYGTVQAFPDVARIVKGRNLDIKVIYGMEGFLTGDDYVNSTVNHVTILAKNKTGLNNLYKLVSLSHLHYFCRRPLIPKRVLESHREGLILGSAGIEGELIRAIVSHKDDEILLQIADFYDYLEIQPSTNYSSLISDEQYLDISSDEDLRNINRKIVNLSRKLDKIVVATGDVRYLNPMDAMSLNSIKQEADNKMREVRSSRYLRTTDEMLNNFSYLGNEMAYEAVVVNSNRVSDIIEFIEPMPEKSYFPILPDADKIIRELSYKKAYTLYGIEIPDVVRNRMDGELSIISKQGYASLYLIWQKLVQKFNENSYITCSRGSIGSSLIANLLDITEVNPLPPHYRCPKCKHSIFITDITYTSGFDLPNKKCSNCEMELLKDGHDIPFATLVSFEGEKRPDININFSGNQQIFHRYVQDIIEKGKVYGAGTIETITYQDAQSYVNAYLRKMGKLPFQITPQNLAERCVGTKKITVAHPSTILINPEDRGMQCFMPIQHSDDKFDGNVEISHFDYHYLSNVLMKMNVISLTALKLLKALADKTQISFTSIPFDDVSTLSLFSSTTSLDMSEDISDVRVGTLGVIDFQNSNVRQILYETKPACFGDLVKASALSHGTNTWHDNARDLIASGTCTIKDVVATRDDIMIYLIQEGIEPIIAFNIMESVRKGKGIRTDFIEILSEHNIPKWYIESCQKIRYLFPRAHVIDYAILGYRTAYYKAHCPDIFYRTYLEICAKESDTAVIKSGISAVQDEIRKYAIENKSKEDYERLEIFYLALEMLLRGYNW